MYIWVPIILIPPNYEMSTTFMFFLLLASGIEGPQIPSFSYSLGGTVFKNITYAGQLLRYRSKKFWISVDFNHPKMANMSYNWTVFECTDPTCTQICQACCQNIFRPNEVGKLVSNWLIQIFSWHIWKFIICFFCLSCIPNIDFSHSVNLSVLFDK